MQQPVCHLVGCSQLFRGAGAGAGASAGRGHKYDLQMTFSITQEFNVFNFPDLSKSLNVWKAGGKQGGGGPGGREGEELTGFYF